MGIKTYSIKKYGRDYKISQHFTLGEMACKDGSDTVLVSTELMSMLEILRKYVGGSITINSGYRTAAYNKKVGGASASQHIKGTAADIMVKRDGQVIPADLICCLCQYLGFNGIGYINKNAVHVDMRLSGSYRGDERNGYGDNVKNNFFSYFNYQVSDILKLKKEEKTEEEEVTQAQFDLMMETWLTKKAKEEPASWSKADREWAEKNGIINGTGNGMEYHSFCTREQMVAFMHRLFKLK